MSTPSTSHHTTVTADYGPCKKRCRHEDVETMPALSRTPSTTHATTTLPLTITQEVRPPSPKRRCRGPDASPATWWARPSSATHLSSQAESSPSPPVSPTTTALPSRGGVDVRVVMSTVDQRATSPAPSHASRHSFVPPEGGEASADPSSSSVAASSSESADSVSEEDLASDEQAQTGGAVSTPDLWDALCSLVDDDDVDDVDADGQEGNYGGGAMDNIHRRARRDSTNRMDAVHDVGVVGWERMDELMVTHEYGAWLTRMTATPRKLSALDAASRRTVR